jgi:electron transfer flavoprotein alpha subunit
MKILVCVKQVPQLDEVRFDRANRVVRDDVESVCNPLDLQALGQALELAADQGVETEIVVLTMGPPAARVVLEDALRSGADRAIQLTDRRFKGADTLATARAIAEIVCEEAPDLVLFGRGTLDGATAQLGQQVAELADLPQLTESVGIRLEGAGLQVDRETSTGIESWQVNLPAAVTVARGPQPPAPTTAAAASQDAQITEMGADELSGEPTTYGTRGSPTFVREVRVHQAERRQEHTADPAAGAGRIHELARRARAAAAPAAWQPHPAGERDVWVLAEHDGETLDPITAEGLAAGRLLADPLDARVTAVLLAPAELDVADELAAAGADRVLHIRNPMLQASATAANSKALAAVLSEASQDERPYVLVAPWTSNGRAYVPRVAARLGLGLVGDATGVEIEAGETPRVGWVKPAWAGTADALVVCRTTPTLATLRPGSYQALGRRADTDGARADVDARDVDLVADERQPRLLGSRTEVADTLVDHAPVVFCLGGDMSTATAGQVATLAERIGAGVGGTREAVGKRLVPVHWELGILKRSIAPRLCVALGVSQADELAPVRGAAELVTVHPDAAVSAHEAADLQVVADVESVVKALLEAPA